VANDKSKEPAGQLAPAPTAAAAAPAPARPKPKDPTEVKDTLREIAETVVFVVVLVLLLKSFAAEAFVIPTGSMADTLLGDHKFVQCQQCGYEFPLNTHSTIGWDPPGTPSNKVTGFTCPNCRSPNTSNITAEDNSSGDRLLVDKSLYDGFLRMEPTPFDIVVFKFPVEPFKNGTPMNYIKRLIGLPGQTIAIYRGDIYVSSKLSGPGPVPHQNPWGYQYQRDSDEHIRADLAAGGFTSLRKAPDKILAMQRIIYDNNYQDKKQKLRWLASAAWQPNSPAEPKTFAHAAKDNTEIDWLRYQHLPNHQTAQPGGPQLITDFLGYNTEVPHTSAPAGENWVGDLILECDATIENAKGSLVLELSKGVDRFQARWELNTGACTLWRNDKPMEVPQPGGVPLKQNSTYHFRLANVDQRLTVWVDRHLIFGEGVKYEPPGDEGPTRNDLEPASIGVAAGGVRVSNIKLWRDTYYGARNSDPDPDPYKAMTPDADAQWPRVDNNPRKKEIADWTNPDKWQPLRDMPIMKMYVQPSHYLCLGDNSVQSFDSRYWGLVPEHLLLGKALTVYWPITRFGWIR